MVLRGNAAALIAALATGSRPSVAAATEVNALLADVAAHARFAVPTRADLTSEDGSGFILQGYRSTIRIDLPGGLRALIRPGKAVAYVGGQLRRVEITSTAAGLPMRFEDLGGFSGDRLRMPQISDESPAGVVVTGAPAGRSTYALLVFTIDPARVVVVKTQYYRGTISNMVMLRREADFTRVGSRWRPGTIISEDLEAGTSRRWHLAWRETPDVPVSAFTPAGLSQ